MNRYLFSILVALTFVLQGCGSSMRVFHDSDPTADFTKFSTYNFLQWTDGNLKTINELERERLKVAFARELENHGLVYKSENADVSVQITVYHKERTDVNYSYSPYYHPYYAHPPRTYNYLERAISIDIYDNSLRKHVWHSAAIGELDYNPQERDKNMPVVTGKMFENFPLEGRDEI